jgi:hypothetical protein
MEVFAKDAYRIKHSKKTNALNVKNLMLSTRNFITYYLIF